MVQTNLPVMLLRNIVLLPFNDIRLEIVSDKDKEVLTFCDKNNDGYILLTNLLDPLEEKPSLEELPKLQF